MSCVLRIEGSPDAIESLVESHSFDLLEVEEQSVAIAVSHASMDDFLQQVRDAIPARQRPCSGRSAPQHRH